MFLDGFKLEVLVTGMPLEEYKFSTYSNSVSNSTPTGPAFSRNPINNEKKYCEHHAYIAIPGTKVQYELRFSAQCATYEQPLLADVYIDGNNDGVCFGLFNPIPCRVIGFWDQKREQISTFKFASTSSEESTDSEAPYNNSNGGTISVYFSRAMHIPGNPYFPPPTAEIRSSPVPNAPTPEDIKVKLEELIVTSEKGTDNEPESKESSIKNESEKGRGAQGTFKQEGTEVTSSQSTPVGETTPPTEITRPRMMELYYLIEEPLAVLHLHYRPLKWLIAQEMLEASTQTIHPALITTAIQQLKAQNDAETVPETKAESSEVDTPKEPVQNTSDTSKHGHTSVFRIAKSGNNPDENPSTASGNRITRSQKRSQIATETVKTDDHEGNVKKPEVVEKKRRA